MYVLLHNNEIVVGPRTWLFSEFKEYLDDNGLDSTQISRVPPLTPFFGVDYQILSVEITEPSYNPIFEQLRGPFFELGVIVQGTYEIVDKDISAVKSLLKSIIASNRYDFEIGGTPAVIQGTTVNLFTNREDRQVYLDAFLLASENTVYKFKFNGSIFLSLTKSDLGFIVGTVAGHLQAAFDWEASKIEEIEACTTIAELKLVDLTVS